MNQNRTRVVLAVGSALALAFVSPFALGSDPPKKDARPAAASGGAAAASGGAASAGSTGGAAPAAAASHAAPAAADKGGTAEKGGAAAKGGEHGKEVHWGYAGEGAPEEWGRLKADYLVCYTGKQQSPIDIRKTAQKNLPPLVFNYVPSKLSVVNNGHTVQYNFDAGSTLEADGKKYDLVQTHFHTPSEHAIGGKRFPAEFHLVHKSQDGKLAVVGVMLEPSGTANAGYKKFLAAAPSDAGEERKNPNVQVSPADLLPKNRAYVTYPGSLTTPPCTEGVSWYVLVKPAEVAAAQLEELKKLYAGNARPLQRLNDRDPVSSAALPTQ